MKKLLLGLVLLVSVSSIAQGKDKDMWLDPSYRYDAKLIREMMQNFDTPYYNIVSRQIVAKVKDTLPPYRTIERVPKVRVVILDEVEWEHIWGAMRRSGAEVGYIIENRIDFMKASSYFLKDTVWLVNLGDTSQSQKPKIKKK